jgi:dinuclear metal center YbgI/SA1388 family protein
MDSVAKVTRFLNKTLSVREIPDKSRNGLQVRGKKTVSKVGVAVDACMQTFTKAKKLNCDYLIVHHGLFWRGKRDVAKVNGMRRAYLLDNNISIYVAHLPLDLHGEYGNNILLAKLLGLEKIRKFGRYHGRKIGYMGVFERARDVSSVASNLSQSLGKQPDILQFGKAKISSVGVVSGGGSSAIYEAYLLGLDCLITGEAPHQTYHDALDLRMNVILAGHYETETLGVKALGELLEREYGLKWVFLDSPTGL